MSFEEKRRHFVQLLLQWGKDNKRMFPWRKSRTPYNILMAEILLQRTPVSRVANFFPKLIAEFPSPQSIVNADVKQLDEFLRPMGLRKKVMWLIELMEQICKEYDCQVPDREEELLKLSGIGLYTARAILIFAFSKDLAIVDVNIARVLQRVFSNLSQRHERPSENNELWNFASGAVPKGSGLQYNEILLDFAAIVCKKKPLCGECPLNHLCDYYIYGQTTESTSVNFIM